MSIESLRDLVAQLTTSATALTILGAELQSRVSGTPLHPTVRPHADAILRDIGALAALDGTSADELRPLIAEIRHFSLIDSDFLATPNRAPGWTYTESTLLTSGGEATQGFPNALARIAPQLDGLVARLEGKDGTFLDVGTGVGLLSIAMTRRWPSLRAVGIDAWAPSLALARENVAAAGLQDRIELREQFGQDMPDEAAFDLAWIPAPFVPQEMLAGLVERVHRALKPGGWVLFATAKPGDDLRGAVMGFRVSLYGGRPTTQDEVEALLAKTKFIDVRALPGPPKDFKLVVAARRAP
jgi:SAM-dependent methyltransferase